MPVIENPSDLDEFSDVERFFIFGETNIDNRLHSLLVGRYPTRFYGFLVEGPTNKRQRESQFSLRYWMDTLPHLGAGDLVFMAQRNSEVETQLAAKGVRIARHNNLMSIYCTYETPTMLHFCKTYIKKEGIALDIGGNTGLTGAMLSRFCEHVHIFEANPEMEASIRATNEGNEKFTLHMMAVYKSKGSVPIYHVGTNNTSMVPSEKTEPILVPSIAIDEFCAENNIKPSVLKIDVEGVDGEVILGARDTIAAHRPLIFLEHPLVTAGAYATNREAAAEALAFLAEIYDLFAFPAMDELYPAYALNMPLGEFEKEFNSVPVNVGAVPKS